eukprot:1187506-Prorocentrum_minimum.AAC.1
MLKRSLQSPHDWLVPERLGCLHADVAPGNWLTDEGVKLLAVPLTPDVKGEYNHALTSLDLSGTRMGPAGAETIATVLFSSPQGVYNTSLKEDP